MALSFQSNTINNFLSHATTFMNSNVSAVVNRSTADCTARNYVTIMLGLPPTTTSPGCTAQVNDSSIIGDQTASASCSLASNNSVTLSNTIKSEVENEIEQLMSQETKAVQEFLALGQAAFNMNSAEFSTKITNEFITAVSQSTTNVCVGVFEAYNEYNLVLCGTINRSTINPTQDASITAMTSCVNTILHEASTEQTAFNSTLQVMDQYASTEQKGIGSVLVWIVVGLGILVVLAVIGTVLYFVLRKKPGAPAVESTPLMSVPATTTEEASE